MNLQHRLADYTDGGSVFEGRIVWDERFSRPRPGVLVAHAWGGRSDYEDGKADGLARLGYAALTPVEGPGRQSRISLKKSLAGKNPGVTK